MHFSTLSRLCLLVVLSLGLLLSTGCASTAVDDVKSVTDAGTTSVKTDKVIGDENDKDLGTNYEATFGKEYDSFSAELEFDDQCAPKKMTVNATGVGAFEGQRYASAAVTEIQARLSEMGEQISEDAWPAVTDILMKYLAPAASPPGS